MNAGGWWNYILRNRISEKKLGLNPEGKKNPDEMRICFHLTGTGVSPIGFQWRRSGHKLHQIPSVSTFLTNNRWVKLFLQCAKPENVKLSKMGKKYTEWWTLCCVWWYLCLLLTFFFFANKWKLLWWWYFASFGIFDGGFPANPAQRVRHVSSAFDAAARFDLTDCFTTS